MPVADGPPPNGRVVGKYVPESMPFSISLKNFPSNARYRITPLLIDGDWDVNTNSMPISGVIYPKNGRFKGTLKIEIFSYNNEILASGEMDFSWSNGNFIIDSTFPLVGVSVVHPEIPGLNPDSLRIFSTPPGSRMPVNIDIDVSCNNPNSFLPDTLIKTPLGDVPIKNIKEGDKIISYNLADNKKAISEVKKVIKSTTESYYIINNKLKITGNHLVYSNGKWISAGELKAEGSLFDGEKNIEIESIKQMFESSYTYNLNVELYDNFFAENILVHNEDAYSVKVVKLGTITLGLRDGESFTFNQKYKNFIGEGGVMTIYDYSNDEIEVTNSKRKFYTGEEFKFSTTVRKTGTGRQRGQIVHKITKYGDVYYGVMEIVADENLEDKIYFDGSYKNYEYVNLNSDVNWVQYTQTSLSSQKFSINGFAVQDLADSPDECGGKCGNGEICAPNSKEDFYVFYFPKSPTSEAPLDPDVEAEQILIDVLDNYEGLNPNMYDKILSAVDIYNKRCQTENPLENKCNFDLRRYYGIGNKIKNFMSKFGVTEDNKPRIILVRKTDYKSIMDGGQGSFETYTGVEELDGKLDEIVDAIKSNPPSPNEPGSGCIKNPETGPCPNDNPAGQDETPDPSQIPDIETGGCDSDKPSETCPSDQSCIEEDIYKYKYSFMISNPFSDVSARCTLSVADPDYFDIEFSPRYLELAPGEIKTINAKIAPKYTDGEYSANIKVDCISSAGSKTIYTGSPAIPSIPELKSRYGTDPNIIKESKSSCVGDPNTVDESSCPPKDLGSSLKLKCDYENDLCRLPGRKNKLGCCDSNMQCIDKSVNSDKFVSSTVRIICNNDKETNIGSGTIIGKDNGEYVILSVAHNFKLDNAECNILFYSNDGIFPSTGSKFLAIPISSQILLDKEKDLAVFKINFNFGVDLPVTPLADCGYNYVDEQDINSLGYGKEQNLVPPIKYPGNCKEIFCHPVNKNLDLLRCSTKPEGGDSGGGLYDECGNLIGVTKAQDLSHNEDGAYIMIRDICSFLDQQGLSNLHR